MSRKGENIYHRKDGRWEGRYIIGRKGEGGYRFGYVYGRTYQEVKQKLAVRRCEAVLAVMRRSGQRTEGRPAEEEFAACSEMPTEMAGHLSISSAEKRPNGPSAADPSGDPAGDPGEKRIGEYAGKWLSSVERHVKESTYVKYRNLLNSYILPALGDLEWRGFSRETLELFLNRLRASGGVKGQGLSAKTVSDILSVVRQVCRYACGNGAEMRFDISSVTVKRETKEMRILTRKEQDGLCGVLCGDPDDRSIGILISLYAGLRLGEVCALRWEDISFEEQTVTVRRTMQRIQTANDPERKTKIVITEPKSKSSVRQIPIPDELAEILSSRRAGRSGYVLTGRDDVYVEPRTMERYFERFLKKAGIGPVNFHALRHTFATRCVEIGFDVKSLSVLLGHANVNITLNRYVHPPMELKRRNMQKLSELLAVYKPSVYAVRIPDPVEK